MSLAVDGVVLVPPEIGEHADEKVGEVVGSLPVDLGEDGEIGIGSRVHPPEVHVLGVTRHGRNGIAPLC